MGSTHITCSVRAVDAQAVAVDDGDEALQPEMAGGHRRFPHLALVQFAVAQHAMDAVAAVLHPARQRHADRDRQAVAERAGAEIDARRFFMSGWSPNGLPSRV